MKTKYWMNDNQAIMFVWEEGSSPCGYFINQLGHIWLEHLPEDPVLCEDYLERLAQNNSMKEVPEQEALDSGRFTV